MSENNVGIITILEDIDLRLKSLLAELPFFEDKPVDFDGIKAQFDDVLENVNKACEKTIYTNVLVQSVINSIYSSRSELKDSVDGLLRKTGDQLGKITATTEAATNKILDEAMKLDNDQNTIIDKLEELKVDATPEDLAAHVESLKAMIYDNQDSVFNIIQFLQFQDITAQQIKGAYSLLHDTEKTLIFVSNLLKEFELAKELHLPNLDRNAFNENAVFGDKKGIQGAIDDLFNTGDTSTVIPDDEVQAGSGDLAAAAGGSDAGGGDFDIDALFNAGGGDSAPAGATATTQAADEEIDIDALFSADAKT